MSDINRNNKNPSEDSTTDGSSTPNFQRDQRTTRSMRKAGAGNNLVEMYFPEVDVNIRSHPSRESSVPLGQIRSTDDISSGYSSADPVYAGEMTGEGLMRTSSVGGARARASRGGSSRAASKRGLTTEDSDFPEDFDGPLMSSAAPSSSTWVPNNPTIPFYPSPFPSMCISSASDEKLLFSANLDVIKNQFMLLKAFQDAQMYMGNSPLINQNDRQFLNVSNILIRGNSNFSDPEIINNNDKSGDSNEKFGESSDNNELNEKLSENFVQDPDKNQDHVPNPLLNSNCLDIKPEEKTDQSASDNPKLMPEFKDSEKSNLVVMEEFHDSLTDNSDKFLSLNSDQRDRVENKIDFVSNIDSDINKMSESPEVVNLSEGNKAKDDTIEVETPKNEIIVPETELKPKTPVRKRRYYKKKPAPLPPNTSKTDVLEQEIDEDYFEDAESDILISEIDNLKVDNKGSSLENAPDLISEIIIPAMKNNEPEVLENKTDAAIQNIENNLVSDKKLILESPRKSDTPSFTNDGKIKAKSQSKLSKFLPKSSNMPSLFGFLHSKDSHSELDETNTDSISISESIASASDIRKEEEKLDGIFIPLTEDKKDEFIQIREMSQSPTAKRKHPDGF